MKELDPRNQTNSVTRKCLPWLPNFVYKYIVLFIISIFFLSGNVNINIVIEQIIVGVFLDITNSDIMSSGLQLSWGLSLLGLDVVFIYRSNRFYL